MMHSILNFRNCLICIPALMLIACAGSRSAVSSKPDPSPQVVDDGYELRMADQVNQSNISVKPNERKPSNLSLTEMVQRLPGVRVSGGSGAYAKFVVDGTSNSFLSGTDPLFVVNGRVIGTDYSMVYTLVNPHDVISVSVLKGSEATLYGSRGANGVIVIRTK